MRISDWSSDVCSSDLVLERSGAENGDVIFFGADKSKVVSDALGALRLKIGNDLKFTVDGWRALWVVDWPMFERDDEAGRWVSLHHPFTAPKPRSEEHPSELQSLMRISYAVFCLKKKHKHA